MWHIDRLVVVAGEAKTIVEFLSAAAAFVTIAAFLIPYVGLLEALGLDGVLVTMALVSVRLWTRSRSQPVQRESSTDRPVPGRKKSSGDSALVQAIPTTEETVVSKSFDVEAGTLTKVELPLEKGNYLFGRLEEEDRQEFSWFIVDIKNLRKAEQNRDFDYETGEDNVPSTAMEWTAPSDGPWYLVLDVSMKQYVRRVTVTLKRRRGSSRQ